jgi:phage FluMu protein Com
VNQPVTVVNGAVKVGVSCPSCGKKIAENYGGFLQFTCPRCKQPHRLEKRDGVDVPTVPR